MSAGMGRKEMFQKIDDIRSAGKTCITSGIKIEECKAIYIKYCAECPYARFRGWDVSKKQYASFCKHPRIKIDEPVNPDNKQMPDWCPLEREERKREGE